MTATPLSDLRCTLGEGIVWDDALGVLWWTDIQESLLWQHDPATGRERQWPMPQRVGSFVLMGTPGVLIVGLAKQVARFDTRTGTATPLADVEAGNPLTRINDGRADRAGNYVFGTLHEGGPEPLGSFYRFTPLGVLQRLALPSITVANSIAFSPDGTTMYWCDTHSRRIHACDYDGQTVDADGCLWNAEWGGNRITRYTPDGRVLAHYPVPASQPTCPAFGGAAFDTLYLASARDGLPARRLAEDAQAGAVFRLAVTGVLREPNALACYPLVPWSNRIGGGRFTFDGRVIDVPRTRDDEPYPLHGHGWRMPWQPVADSGHAIELAARVEHARPFRYLARLRYALAANTLRMTLTVRNEGEPLPFGLGVHPFFPRTADVRLHAPATGMWHAAPDHLPTMMEAPPSSTDFGAARRLEAGAGINHSFEGWNGHAEIVWPSRRLSVAIAAATSRYVLYTTPGRDFFCFEPVDHAINAHNLPGRPQDHGLIVLATGQSLQRDYRFTVTPFRTDA